MAKRVRRPDQGFSVYALQGVIAECVDKLTDALNEQGLVVNADDLLLQIQSLVLTVGRQSNPNMAMGYMAASEESRSAPAPYSLSGDYLVSAARAFRRGDRARALRHAVVALAQDDIRILTAGIERMNEESEIAREADNAEGVDDSSLNDAGEHLSEDEIAEALRSLEADDSENENSDQEAKPIVPAHLGDEEVSETDDAEDIEEEPDDESVPMGGTGSTPVTASDTKLRDRILANKLSLDGSKTGRTQAQTFLKSRLPASR